MVRSLALGLSLSLLCACGSKVRPADGGSDTTETTAAPSTTDATTAPSTDTAGPGEGTTSVVTSDSEESSGASSGSAGWPPDLGEGPIIPCTEYEDVDVFDSYTYRRCLRGLGRFTFEDFGGGDVLHSAYAQFFEVYAEAVIVVEEVLHDPHEGLDDCGARTRGKSSSGESEKVLWEDAGDLTFIGPDFEIPGEQYGDPMSVIGYEGDLASYEPRWEQLHGLETTGATTPAYDLRDTIYLPDRIEVIAPTLTAATSVPRDGLLVEWTPSDLAIPTWLFLNFKLGGGQTLTIACEMEDDGSFQVPPDLLELAPLPATANVYLSRTDRHMVMQDEIHAIRMEGRTSRSGKLTIE